MSDQRRVVRQAGANGDRFVFQALLQLNRETSFVVPTDRPTVRSRASSPCSPPLLARFLPFSSLVPGFPRGRPVQSFIHLLRSKFLHQILLCERREILRETKRLGRGRKEATAAVVFTEFEYIGGSRSLGRGRGAEVPRWFSKLGPDSNHRARPRRSGASRWTSIGSADSRPRPEHFRKIASASFRVTGGARGRSPEKTGNEARRLRAGGVCDVIADWLRSRKESPLLSRKFLLASSYVRGIQCTMY